MILKRVILFIAFAITVSVFPMDAVFSQAASLETEIQNIERSAARQGASPVERHAALVRLAGLRQLAGDIEGAARNWLEAAAAIPGFVDDEALLACAYCLAAMGEWDRAAAALAPLLSKNVRARFLDIGIKAIKTGETSALAAIAANPEYSEIKQEILFLLWKISQRAENRNGERWRQQLVSEFPHTPEGRIAAGQSASSVIVNPSPFWLFISGLDSLSVLASEPRNNAAAPAARPTPVVQAPTAQSAVQPSAAQPAAAKLQTGVFSREANARAQMTALTQAGFSPSIEQRGERWAVTVPAGQDVNRTINSLRAAGFESFLIR
jgi:hypothetical protein